MKTIRTRMRYKNFELSLIFESVSDVVLCNDDNVFYVKSLFDRGIKWLLLQRKIIFI